MFNSQEGFVELHTEENRPTTKYGMVLLKVISKPPTHQSLDGSIKGDQQTTNTSKFALILCSGFTGEGLNVKS